MTLQRCAAAALLVVLASAGATYALETDQYYAWGHPLEDSTPAINGKVHLELQRALSRVNALHAGGAMTCHQVTKRIVPHFRQFIFKNIGLWAKNAPMVDAVPSTVVDELHYRKTSIYHDTGAFDLSGLIPPSPTISLGGVHVGTDKLAHFFSEGHWYYVWYRTARRKGLDHDAATARVVDRGLFFEKTILGMTSSGVLSLGDLEANYQGLRFYIDLCEGDDPYLERANGNWRLRRAFDFNDYVTPEWDESYHPPIFTGRRWKRVKPLVRQHCARLQDAEVVEQREAYARVDHDTLTERRLWRRIEAGKLADPTRFSIETVCAEQ